MEGKKETPGSSSPREGSSISPRDQSPKAVKFVPAIISYALEHFKKECPEEFLTTLSIPEELKKYPQHTLKLLSTPPTLKDSIFGIAIWEKQIQPGITHFDSQLITRSLCEHVSQRITSGIDANHPHHVICFELIMWVISMLSKLPDNKMDSVASDDCRKVIESRAKFLNALIADDRIFSTKNDADQALKKLLAQISSKLTVDIIRSFLSSAASPRSPRRTRSGTANATASTEKPNRGLEEFSKSLSSVIKCGKSTLECGTGLLYYIPSTCEDLAEPEIANLCQGGVSFQRFFNTRYGQLLKILSQTNEFKKLFTENFQPSSVSPATSPPGSPTPGSHRRLSSLRRTEPQNPFVTAQKELCVPASVLKVLGLSKDLTISEYFQTSKEIHSRLSHREDILKSLIKMMALLFESAKLLNACNETIELAKREHALIVVEQTNDQLQLLMNTVHDLSDSIGLTLKIIVKLVQEEANQLPEPEKRSKEDILWRKNIESIKSYLKPLAAAINSCKDATKPVIEALKIVRSTEVKKGEIIEVQFYLEKLSSLIVQSQFIRSMLDASAEEKAELAKFRAERSPSVARKDPLQSPPVSRKQEEPPAATTAASPKSTSPRERPAPPSHSPAQVQADKLASADTQSADGKKAASSTEAKSPPHRRLTELKGAGADEKPPSNSVSETGSPSTRRFSLPKKTDEGRERSGSVGGKSSRETSPRDAIGKKGSGSKDTSPRKAEESAWPTPGTQMIMISADPKDNTSPRSKETSVENSTSWPKPGTKIIFQSTAPQEQGSPREAASSVSVSKSPALPPQKIAEVKADTSPVSAHRPPADTSPKSPTKKATEGSVTSRRSEPSRSSVLQRAANWQTQPGSNPVPPTQTGDDKGPNTQEKPVSSHSTSVKPASPAPMSPKKVEQSPSAITETKPRAKSSPPAVKAPSPPTTKAASPAPTTPPALEAKTTTQSSSNDTKVETHTLNSEASAPKAETRAPNSGVPAPKTEARTPNPEVLAPKPEARTPNSGVPAPKPETQTPNSEVLAPKPEARTPNSGVPAPKPEARTPNSTVSASNNTLDTSGDIIIISRQEATKEPLLTSTTPANATADKAEKPSPKTKALDSNPSSTPVVRDESKTDSLSSTSATESHGQTTEAKEAAITAGGHPLKSESPRETSTEQTQGVNPSAQPEQGPSVSALRTSAKFERNSHEKMRETIKTLGKPPTLPPGTRISGAKKSAETNASTSTTLSTTSTADQPAESLKTVPPARKRATSMVTPKMMKWNSATPADTPPANSSVDTKTDASTTAEQPTQPTTEPTSPSSRIRTPARPVLTLERIKKARAKVPDFSAGSQASPRQIEQEASDGSQSSPQQIRPAAADSSQSSSQQIRPEVSDDSHSSPRQIRPAAADSSQSSSHQIRPEASDGSQSSPHQIRPAAADSSQSSSQQIRPEVSVESHQKPLPQAVQSSDEAPLVVATASENSHTAGKITIGSGRNSPRQLDTHSTDRTISANRQQAPLQASIGFFQQPPITVSAQPTGASTEELPIASQLRSGTTNTPPTEVFETSIHSQGPGARETMTLDDDVLAELTASLTRMLPKEKEATSTLSEAPPPNKSGTDNSTTHDNSASNNNATESLTSSARSSGSLIVVPDFPGRGPYNASKTGSVRSRKGTLSRSSMAKLPQLNSSNGGQKSLDPNSPRSKDTLERRVRQLSARSGRTVVNKPSILSTLDLLESAADESMFVPGTQPDGFSISISPRTSQDLSSKVADWRKIESQKVVSEDNILDVIKHRLQQNPNILQLTEKNLNGICVHLLCEFLLSQYELCWTSILPNSDLSKAQPGKIYIDKSGKYFVLDAENHLQEGVLKFTEESITSALVAKKKILIDREGIQASSLENLKKVALAELDPSLKLKYGPEPSSPARQQTKTNLSNDGTQPRGTTDLNNSCLKAVILTIISNNNHLRRPIKLETLNLSLNPQLFDTSTIKNEALNEHHIENDPKRFPTSFAVDALAELLSPQYEIAPQVLSLAECDLLIDAEYILSTADSDSVVLSQDQYNALEDKTQVTKFSRNLRNFVNALRKNETLEFLDLRGTGLDDNSVRDICRALEEHPKICTVFLGNNNFSKNDVSGEALLTLVTTNRRITGIDLTGTKLSNEMVTSVEAQVEANEKQQMNGHKLQ